MSMLSGLRVGETEAGAMPNGLIMIVSAAPLSTNILAGHPIVVSQQKQLSREASCDLALWLACLTEMSTCLQEIRVIVCSWNPEMSVSSEESLHC